MRDEKGKIQPQARQQEVREVGACLRCGGDVVIKKSHTGSWFLSCANYPKCTYAAPFSTGVPCPKCGKGNLVEKVPSEAKSFIPAINIRLRLPWDWPINEKCPECDSPLLVLENHPGAGRHIACPNPKCRYSRDTDEPKE